MEPGPSPFALIPESEWLCASPLCFAIFDSFPVSPGHVLVITRRVVATWFDCTPDEQAALMQLVGEVRGLLDERLDPKPDGYNVGFNAGAAAGQTVPHVHVHVIPRYAGDMGDPRGGVRHVIPGKGNYLAGPPAPSVGADWQSAHASPIRQIANLPLQADVQLSLTTGAARPLWPRLAERLPGATEIDLLASFVQVSGLDIVQESLFSALAAGAKVRLLVGDYLGITSPDALQKILGWMQSRADEVVRPGMGTLEARLVELATLAGTPESFHPKAWRIADSSGGIVVVGSSNLSRAALQTGVEWNLIVESAAADCLEARGASRGNAAPTPIEAELQTAFGDLWRQATPLSADVVERYTERAAAAAEMRRVWDAAPLSASIQALSASEGSPGNQPPHPQCHPAPATFAPRPWQREALASLAAIRRDGYSKALVAVATGLGKTWLAAFDCVAMAKDLGRPPRVLVIAHRAEILAQAESTLRQAMESEWRDGEASTGFRRGLPGIAVSYVAGSSADFSGQLVIASIQKIARPDGLAALAAERFDYCVIDEVHHAEAPSYRRVLARLAAGFTLGLTATPERTDGVDVATLFDDILAAQATIGDGIAEGSLVPFRYRGLKDDVDYDSSKIPWRNGRFDVSVLEAALENSARMERLWAEWQRGDGAAASAGSIRRTLVFCCSRRHALFARDWLVRRGVTAAAVFSGDGGDPRMASLSAFRKGSLSALCVVDLFNEGIDLPLVDRVVMLRPTESKIVFLQQLGRGLRAAEGKTHLDVIDFVGNHRVFASRLMHLFSLSPRGALDAAPGWAVVRSFLEGESSSLPAGCVVDVDVEAKELLGRLVPAGGAVAVEAYRSLRADLGRRPTPSELFHAGYLPSVIRVNHDGWFSFCAAEGDLDTGEQAVVDGFGQWFRMLETTNLTKSYKMVVLRVLLDRDGLWDGMEIDALATACRQFLENHPALRADLAEIPSPKSPGRKPGGPGPESSPSPSPSAPDPAFTAYWLKWPLSRWMADQSGRRWFTRRGDVFAAAFSCPPEQREAFERLTGELVDYRLAHYSRSRLASQKAPRGSEGVPAPTTFRAKLSHSSGKPILRLPEIEKNPARPTGPTRVRLPDGSEWVFKFVKVACNVAHPADSSDKQNQLPALLREWFGPDAGLPGTTFEVEFASIDGQWRIAPTKSPGRKPGDSGSEPPPNHQHSPNSAPPLDLLDNPPPPARYTTHVPVYDLTAAAGLWGPESVPEQIGWTEVPDAKLAPGMFVAQVVGKSMEPLIPDGSWCLFRPCPAGSREGRIVLVQFASLGAGENGGRFTVKKYHSEKTITADGWRHERIQLLPVNPAFEPITLKAENTADLFLVAEFALQLSQTRSR